MTTQTDTLSFQKLLLHQQLLTRLADYTHQLCIAQEARLMDWMENGAVDSDDNCPQMIIDENSEVLDSLYRKQDRLKKGLLAISQQMRKERENIQRRKRMDAARRKKK